MSLLEVNYRIGSTIQAPYFIGASNGNVDVREGAQLADVLRVLQGDRGLPGTSTGAQEFVQASASAVWTIPHNMGRKPLAELFTAGGLKMFGEQLHLSNNVLQISFDVPTVGFVVLI